MRFAWGLLIGLVVGGIVALAIFADPLCRRGIAGKLGTVLDQLGLPKTSPVREVVEGAIYN